MKFTISTSVGKNPLVIEGDAQNPIDLFNKCSQLMQFPEKCGNQSCGSTDLAMVVKNGKTKEGRPVQYYLVQCRTCLFDFKYGQHQGKPTLFPKGWQPPYNPDTQSQPRTAPQADQFDSAPPPSDEGMPW